jgi:hypothetical protein
MLLGTINTQSYSDGYRKKESVIRSSSPLKIGSFRVRSFSLKTPNRKLEDRTSQKHFPDSTPALRGVFTWAEPKDNHSVEYVILHGLYELKLLTLS